MSALPRLLGLPPLAAGMVGPTDREDLHRFRVSMSLAAACTVFGAAWFRTGWAVAACLALLGLWAAVEVLVHWLVRRLLSSAMKVAAETDDPIRYLAEFEAFCALPRADRNAITAWLASPDDDRAGEEPVMVARWRAEIARRRPATGPRP